VEVAFLVTGDGGPEHDNVVSLRGRKRRDNGDEESWVSTCKFFDEGGSLCRSTHGKARKRDCSP
jgi:hypothetical protein